MLNMSQRRSFDRAGEKSIEAQIDAAKAELAAEDAERRAAMKARQAELEAGRRKYERADLVGARFVRVRSGWWTVTRVNQKTVSCESGGLTARFEFKAILAHKGDQ